MKYIPIPEDRFPDVILHLRNTFFPDEPLNKSVDLCAIGEAHTDLEIHSWNTMEQGFSVLALSDDDEVLTDNFQTIENKLKKYMISTNRLLESA